MFIQKLRNMTKPFMWATLILVIPSFIFLYGSSKWEQRKEAERELFFSVNGSPVYREQFQMTQNRQLDQMRRQYGDRWTDQMEKALKVSEKTKDALIESRLIRERSQDLNVKVSKKNLQDSIKKMYAPYFPEGKWDPIQYRRMVEYSMNMPVGEFERLMREGLEDKRLQELVSMGYAPTEAELRKAFGLEKTEYEVEYLRIPVSDFQNTVVVADEKLAAYFEENKDKYEVPEGVRVRYLHFRAADFESGVEPAQVDMESYFDKNAQSFEIPERMSADCFLVPSPSYEAFIESSTEELHEYYNGHRTDYEDPEEYLLRYTYIPTGENTDCQALTREEAKAKYEKNVRKYNVKTEQAKVRQILIEAGKPSKEKEATAKIKTVRQEIVDGKSFADAAKEYSQDKNTNEKGGDLGWLARSDYGKDPGVLDAAFSLEIGGISEPIRTPQGYVLITVEDRQKTRVKPFAEVEVEIRKEMARKILGDLRDELLNKGFTPESMKDHAGLPIVTPPMVSAKTDKIDDVLGEKGSSAVLSGVRVFKSGDLSGVIDAGDMMVLAELVNKKPVRPWSYDEALDKVKIALAESKANKAAGERASTLAKRAVDEKISFEALAAEVGSPVIPSGTFEKTDTLEFLGEESKQFVEQAALIKEGAVEPVETTTKVYMVHVTGRDQTRLPSFDEVKDEVRTAVQKAKATETAQDYLSSIQDYFLDAEEKIKEGELPESEKSEVTIANAARIAQEKLKITVPDGAYGELPPDRFITTKDMEREMTVPVSGWNQEVSMAALLLQKPGERSSVIPIIRDYTSQVAGDYFLLELIERRETRAPESWQEVREDVENDYVRSEGIRLAKAQAEKVDGELEAALKAGETTGATNALNLRAFARSREVEFVGGKPAFSARSYRIAFPTATNPIWILKTIEKMEPQDYSGLIENQERVWETYGPILESKRRVKELVPEGYYIVHLLTKKEPNWNDYEGMRTSLQLGLMRQRVGSKIGDTSPITLSWTENLKKGVTVDESKEFKDLMAAEEQ